MNPYADVKVSFWRDLMAQSVARAQGVSPDPDVLARLVELDRSYEGYARRDIGTSALGSLIPEQPAPPTSWGVPQSRRPFVDAFLAAGGGVEMPPTGMVVSIPSSLTAGFAAVSQTSQNTAVGESNPVYVNRSCTLVTVATQINVSRQAFDRGSNMDGNITREALASLDTELERQVITGTGSNGELPGLIQAASYVTLSATFGADAIRSTLQASRLAAEATKVPTRIVLMAPRRWYHWGAQAIAATTTLDSVDFAGQGVAGIPIVLSGSVPQTVSSDQDRILALTPGVSAVLALDAPRVQISLGTSPHLGTVKVIASQYAALVTRSPTMIQCVSGTGLAAPAAF